MTYDDLDRLITTASPMWRSDAMFSYDELDNITYMRTPIRDGLKVYRDRYYCYDVSWRLTNLKTGSCGGPTVMGLGRSEEHTSELQSLMRISYAVFCLKKKTKNTEIISTLSNK